MERSLKMRALKGYFENWVKSEKEWSVNKMGEASTESYMFELENEFGNRLSIVEVADEVGRGWFVRIENKEMDYQQFEINKRIARK